MKKIGVVLILTLLFFTSLSLFTPSSASEEDGWTMMVYMGGDREDEDISGQVTVDILEFESVSEFDDLNVLVLADQKGEGNSRLLYIEDGESEEIPLNRINSSWGNELNMGAESTLKEFVSWGIENYAAKRYFLDLWGHGNGWKGMPLEDDDRLKLPEMDRALEGVELDIIGFDTCTLSLFETYYQLREHSDVIIASEKEEAINGWPYHNIVDEVGTKEDIGTDEFARTVVDEFISWSRNHSELSSSLTAVKTKKLPLWEFKMFTSELRAMMPFYEREIRSARQATESYSPYPFPRDLVHFIQNLKSNINSTRLDRVSDMLITGLKESIIAHRVFNTGSDNSANNSNGFGIYFPSGGVPPEYTSIEFINLEWDEWLTRFDDPPSLPDNDELTLNVTVSDEKEELVIFTEHVSTGAEIQLEVVSDDSVIRRYNYKNKVKEIKVNIEYGDYLVDVQLVNNKTLINHTRESVEVYDIIELKGDVIAKSDVFVSIHNPERDKWKNITLEPGSFTISLKEPKFCQKGDTLEVTYRDDERLERTTLRVDSDEIKYDFKLKTWFSFFSWIFIVEFIILFIMISIYLKRKSGLKKKIDHHW